MLLEDLVSKKVAIYKQFLSTMERTHSVQVDDVPIKEYLKMKIAA